MKLAISGKGGAGKSMLAASLTILKNFEAQT
jgi:CO dehydrogenase nickel-insertion accessory protein CooC1